MWRARGVGSCVRLEGNPHGGQRLEARCHAPSRPPGSRRILVKHKNHQEATIAMDPETTVEALLVIGKTAGIIGGGCAVTLASMWGMGAGAIDYYQRKDRRNELMPLYEQGIITTKPTILNAYRIPGHEM